MWALILQDFGGPEVLEHRELPDPAVPTGHVQLAMTAIGLNFADIYRRRGNHPIEGRPPYILGYEGVGVVVAANAAPGFALGDRVGFADVPFANATRVNVAVDRAIPLPDDIDDPLACSLLLQGLTAQYLLTDSHLVRAGSTVLVHAAAGGVGQLLTQLAKARGAVVIAVTSTEQKRSVALEIGADHGLLYSDDWSSSVRDITHGGADVAYDAAGSTLLDSIAAVRNRGTVVAYGTANGDPPPIDPRMLMASSKALVGADLWDHVDSREQRLEKAQQLFDSVRTGQIRRPRIETFPLSQGGAAHARLESRLVTGKIVMTPGHDGREGRPRGRPSGRD
jgi:NADPH:quinone reductase